VSFPQAVPGWVPAFAAMTVLIEGDMNQRDLFERDDQPGLFAGEAAPVVFRPDPDKVRLKLHRILAEEAARREAVFQQSVDAEKTRGDVLSRRFEEALKQAHQEPVTKPTRDFDLD